VTNKTELSKFKAIHTVTPVYPLKHNNVYFIPNFVDGNKYKPFPKDDEFTVGYSSRKIWAKGWDIFLKLEELMEDIKFVVTDNIPEPEMPQFHSRNHVTVVPARVDTFGLVNVESMLCGTPVISSGLPTHKVLGLPIRYAYRLEEYIKEIDILRDLYEAGMYNSISEICRNSALKYDKSLIIDKLETMFEEVAK